MDRKALQAMRSSGKRRRLLIPLLVVIILAGTGIGYTLWQRFHQVTAQAATSTMNTTRVRLGDITISVTGAGTLTAGKESNLSFSTAGTVKTLNVAVGDSVKAGQTLAELEQDDSLINELKMAQQNLTAAQENLEDVKASAAENLANALLSLSNAEKELIDARSALIPEGSARCDAETTNVYYTRYIQAKDQLEKLSSAGENTQDYYLYTIVPAKNKAAQAYSTYIYCTGYKTYEVDASKANLALAEANAQDAQSKLDQLQANNGVLPADLAAAENKVTSAQIALKKAQETIDGMVIVAPFDGSVLSVGGAAGDKVSGGKFLTLVDLLHPQIQFTIDESDLSKIAVGQAAENTFDAIEDRTFTGTITRIYPTLATVNGYQAVQGIIQMDISKETDLPTMPAGLNASVEIISGKAENALIVPLTALRELGEGEYAVFVVNNGTPRLAIVTVGLMDSASVEIKTGVSEGDIVSTGISESASGSN